MKKNIDGIIRHPKTNHQGLSLGALKESPLIRTTLKTHWPIATAIIFVAILINSVTLLSAFEAHVINVTATIERRPSQCDALSPGYWRNHEGCSGGAGENVWTSQINTLSRSFSGVFAGYDGAAICAAEWQPNCPSAGTREGKLCRAKLHTLADELNLVSGHLDLNALIAGADHGGGAFDRLGLSPASTVAEALTALERVIADNAIDEPFITDAATVAERLYSFYEDENPIAPQCIFDLDQLGAIQFESESSSSEIEPLIEVEISELTATTTITTTEATSTPPVIEEATTTPIVVEETSVTPEVIEAAVEEIGTVETVDESETVEIEVPVSEPVSEPEPAPESVPEPVAETSPAAEPPSEPSE